MPAIQLLPNSTQATEWPTNHTPQPTEPKFQTLLFGIMATLLAAATVVIAWRHFRHQKRSGATNNARDEGQYLEVLDTRSVRSHHNAPEPIEFVLQSSSQIVSEIADNVEGDRQTRHYHANDTDESLKPTNKPRINTRQDTSPSAVGTIERAADDVVVANMTTSSRELEHTEATSTSTRDEESNGYARYACDNTDNPTSTNIVPMSTHASDTLGNIMITRGTPSPGSA